MIHGLSAVFAGVDHYAVTFAEAFIAGDLGSSPEQVAEQGAVVRAALSERDDVLARRDENVHRRLRVDVGEGVAQLVFVDCGGGNASVNDLAKEATHSVFSVQERDSIMTEM
jgi:hypothetical protein